jgi:uncharacterized iron-regulated protein
VPLSRARSAARPPLLRCVAAAALAASGGCAPAASPAAAPAPAEAGYRIFDARGRPVAGLSELARALRGADVVFVGEQHDDSVAHRFERELLEALARDPRPTTLSLEMFERDVQPALDAYLSGALSEREFLAASRPWPNYPEDYRPLVELARARGWPVVAGNVPRPLAAAVARGGLEALDSLPEAERRLAARESSCPRDAYFQRFAREMREHSGSHGPHGGADSPQVEAMIRRLFEAQCVKDETMAESIAGAMAGGRRVVHFGGAFHSDFGQGIPSRLLRRAPDAAVATVSLVPVAEVDDPRAVSERRGIADFLVLTRRPGRGRAPR